MYTHKYMFLQPSLNRMVKKKSLCFPSWKIRFPNLKIHCQKIRCLNKMVCHHLRHQMNLKSMQ